MNTSQSDALVFFGATGDLAFKSIFPASRKELGNAERPAHYLAIPPQMFETVVEHLEKSGCGHPLGFNWRFATIQRCSDGRIWLKCPWRDGPRLSQRPARKHHESRHRLELISTGSLASRRGALS